MLTVGSLFSGIGGFDLGFQRAGFEIRWQVEIDSFCRQLLERHFPHAIRMADVRDVHAKVGCDVAIRSGYESRCQTCCEWVDVLCGGFPCQDISSAGGKAGIDGQQSGLWREMFRLVRELRPRYVVVENVADLLARGFGRVLGDLASIGYDAEWDCIQAAAIGAPHGRDRLWIVAYPHADEGRCQVGGECDGETLQDAAHGDSRRHHVDGLCAAVSNTASEAEAARARRRARTRIDFSRWRLDARQRAGWEAEPAVCRVADGVSPGLDNARLAALGNSLVPQIAEWIASRIKVAEGVEQADACAVKDGY